MILEKRICCQLCDGVFSRRSTILNDWFSLGRRSSETLNFIHQRHQKISSEKYNICLWDVEQKYEVGLKMNCNALCVSSLKSQGSGCQGIMTRALGGKLLLSVGSSVPQPATQLPKRPVANSSDLKKENVHHANTLPIIKSLFCGCQTTYHTSHHAAMPPCEPSPWEPQHCLLHSWIRTK